MSGSGTATVLVVDDEPEVADAYALRLREYDVRKAYGGEEALAKIDDDVDVVLLDRRMPDLTGDEVLSAINERGYDVGVVMLTAVHPDYDIVEMPFNDYLCKPVEKDDLLGAIEQQLQAREADDTLSEYLEVTAKLTLLEVEKSPQEFEQHPEVAKLRAHADELEAEMSGVVDDLDDIVETFRGIDRTA